MLIDRGISIMAQEAKAAVARGFLMSYMRLLLAKQNARIGGPIECQLAILRVSCKWRRTVPRYGRSHSMKLALGAAGRVISMKIRYAESAQSICEVFETQIRARPHVHG